jgi:predicted RNA polymerase sigma factor
MARRRPRLWPITGRPREPGGSLAAAGRRGLFALVRRWRSMGKATAISGRIREESIGEEVGDAATS